jgi:hypothetical protein
MNPWKRVPTHISTSNMNPRVNDESSAPSSSSIFHTKMSSLVITSEILHEGGFNEKYDAVFLRNPWRDEKSFLYVLYPKSIMLNLFNASLLTTVKLMNEHELVKVPTDDRKQLLAFLFDHLSWPMTKFAILTTTMRIYETITKYLVFPSKPFIAAKFIRDVEKVSQEANSVVKSETPADAPLSTLLLARLRVAVHVTKVAPYPAFIANISAATVELLELYTKTIFKTFYRRKAQQILDDPNCDRNKRREAHADLLRYQASDKDILQDTFRIVSLSSASIVTESIFAGFGTFFWPGIGTVIGQLIGSSICFSL